MLKRAATAALVWALMFAASGGARAAGITVDPTCGLETTEAGGTATFTVVLTGEPVADVTIDLASSDTTEGTASPASLTFTPADWNVAQTVTVTGVDDYAVDGDIDYTVAVGIGAGEFLESGGTVVMEAEHFTGSDPRTDPNSVEWRVSTGTAGFVGDGYVDTPGPQGTNATWADGCEVSYDIEFSTTGDYNIWMRVYRPDAASNSAFVGMDGAQVGATFDNGYTYGTWLWVEHDATASVTTTGLHTFRLRRREAAYVVDRIILTTDGAYTPCGDGPAESGRQDLSEVSVTNVDDDVAGITVDPTSGLTTTEAGGTATFTLVLTSQPTGDVAIGLSSLDATEGTVSPASLTFTPTDWNVAQTVTATGVDDSRVDGNIGYTIVVGTGGFLESGGTVVMEAEHFTVADPRTDPNEVEWGISSAIAGFVGDGYVDTPGPQGTNATWADGCELSYDVAFSTTGDYNIWMRVYRPDGASNSAFVGMDGAQVGAEFDNGYEYLVWKWVRHSVTASVSATGPHTFRLRRREAAYIVDRIVLTTDGAYTPCGDGPVESGRTPVTSADPDYASLDPSDVSVTNTDDDVAGIAVAPTSGLTTTEAGGTATFTVALTSEPVADVTMDLLSSDTTEGTVSPASLTFTPADWNVAQTVTATGVDDGEVDGGIGYTIVLGTSEFVESGGTVVMEAEHFAGSDPRTDPNEAMWRISSATAGFVGDGYVDTPGPQGTNGAWADGCELSYEIDFTATGDYSIWMRVYRPDGASNSAFVGLDGAQVGDTFDNTAEYTVWDWVKHGATASVTTTGLHTFRLRRREMDYIVDRIILTTDGTYTPSGDGPAESGRTPVTTTDLDYASLDPADVSVTNTDDDLTGIGLIGHWTFDDSAQPGHDDSGSGNHLTVTGPTWTSEGRINAALNFDGTDDYADIPLSIIGSDVGTVSFWLNTDADFPGRTIVYYGSDVTSGNGYGAQNELNASFDGSERLEFFRGNAGGAVTASSIYADGQWHHVVATWEISDLHLYVDGSLVASGVRGGADFDFSGRHRLGRPGANERHYAGLLDDVRLYNCALNAQQVLALGRAVTFDKSASNGAEGLTPAVIAVSLTAASATTVSVDYSVTGGTATRGVGNDYTLPDGTLVLSPGELRKAISIDVLADDLAEADETIEITLSNAVGVPLGAITVHTYTINDFGIVEREVIDSTPKNDRIDKIRMVASAVLNDQFTGFTVAVADHTVTGFDTGVGGDAEFFILLEEKAEPDTGAPDVQITAQGELKLQSDTTWVAIPLDSGPNTPLDAVAPVVASTSPEDGADPVSVRTGIEVTFSEAMDRLSTQGAFSIDGGVTGSFAWPAADTLVFTPSERLANATTYTVTVGAGAQDLAGNGPAAAHSFWFTTGGGLLVEIPATSTTSPAFIEGEYWQAEGEDYPIIGNGPQGDVAADVLDERRFFVNVPLEAGANTIKVRQEGTSPLVEVSDTVEWAETVIDTDSGQSVTIRKADSLLLVTEETTGTLKIDLDYDGVTFDVDKSGPAGTPIPAAFNLPGEFVVHARVDAGSGDEFAGEMTVVVIEVDLSSPIACQIGYKREKDVLIEPATYASSVHFGASDANLLEVLVKELTGTGATVYLRSLQRGTPVLTARIEGETGPIVAYRQVDEFTLDNTAAYHVNIIHADTGGDEDRSSLATLTLTPFIPDLDVEMWVCSPGLTFDGGLSTLEFSTNGFIEQADGSAIYDYQLHLAPGYDSVCINMDVLQVGSVAHVVADRRGDNGYICEAWIRPKFADEEKNQWDDEGDYTYAQGHVVNEGETFKVMGWADGQAHWETYSVAVTLKWQGNQLGLGGGSFQCHGENFSPESADEVGEFTAPTCKLPEDTLGTIEVKLISPTGGEDFFTMTVMKSGSFWILGPDYVCVGGPATYEAWECSEDTGGAAKKCPATWTTAGVGQVTPPGATNTDTYSVQGSKRSASPDDLVITATRGDKTAEKSVTVCEIVPTPEDVDLWWFHPHAPPTGYSEEQTFALLPFTQGYFDWLVERGGGFVDFENNSDVFSASNDNDVNVKSTGESQAYGDIEVSCYYTGPKGDITCYRSFDVRRPYRMGEDPSLDTLVAWGPGYKRTKRFICKDQFAEEIPRKMDLNEQYGTWTDHIVGHTWGRPVPNSVSATRITDTWGNNDGTDTPPPVNPSDPLAGTKVMEAPQSYFAAKAAIGQGILLKRKFERTYHVVLYMRGQVTVDGE